MADAKPTGKLTTGAIGNFLLGGAMALLLLSGAVSVGGGGGGANEGAGVLGLVAFILMVGGGITAGIGYFGLGSMHGGTNVLAGIFAILVALVPIAALVMGSAGGVRGGMGTIQMIFAIMCAVPGLLGVFGGLGVMKAQNSMAKPAGLVSLIGGIALAAVGVLFLVAIEMFVTSPGLTQILMYVGFFGTAIGFLLTGVAMLGEKNA